MLGRSYPSAAKVVNIATSARYSCKPQARYAARIHSKSVDFVCWVARHMARMVMTFAR